MKTLKKQGAEFCIRGLFSALLLATGAVFGTSRHSALKAPPPGGAVRAHLGAALEIVPLAHFRSLFALFHSPLFIPFPPLLRSPFCLNGWQVLFLENDDASENSGNIPTKKEIIKKVLRAAPRQMIEENIWTVVAIILLLALSIGRLIGRLLYD